MNKRYPAFILFLFLATTALHAQGVKNEAPPVRLGGLDTAHVTCEELLKNDKLVALAPGWQVTKFRISFTMPDGKTYGPFLAQGSALPDGAIKTIKRLKKNKADITIDEIYVIHDGREKFAAPVNLRYNN